MVDRMETSNTVEPGETPRWGLAAALVLLALVLALVVMRSQAPAPRPADAPAAEFSAGRARQVQQELLGDQRPHPVGSPANALVRDRIIARLRALGYEPDVQRAFSCNLGGVGNCAWVENVFARLPGRQSTGVVMMMAHYDSVAGGPGASDAMSGVAAILEVARILKAGPPLRNDVLLVLDDGEEAGLLGAKAFADYHPAAREVKAIINLEARGSAGPSLMFETSGPNAWLVSSYARNAPRPVTSSVFATIYDQLPNDTDLTVFKRRPDPVPGLNFAYIRKPAHYHTALDNLETASPASLQHHGDNALAAVRGLGEADIANPPRGSAVFFDVLSLFVVRWPEPWTLGLAALALILVVAAVARSVRSRTLTGRAVVAGVLGFLLVLIAGALAAFLLQFALRALGAMNVAWLANPLPYLAALWLLVLGVVLLAAGLFRRAGLGGLWAGVWLWWSVLGLVVAFLATGISYLFVVPALVAGLAGALLPRGRWALAAILPLVVAALLWFPVILPLYDGLGGGAFLVIGVLLTLLLTALAPLVPGSGALWRRWVPLGAVVLAVVLLMVGRQSPVFTETSPQPVSLQYHLDGDTGQARWLARFAPPFPESLRQGAKFGDSAVQPFPWSPPFARAFAAPAPAAALPAPDLTVLENTATGGKRTVRFRLSSPRGAWIAGLIMPAAAQVESMEVGGIPLRLDELTGRGGPQPGSREAPAYRTLTFLSVPPQGIEVQAVLGASAPADWYVLDRSPGLPAGGEALVKARPATASTFQDGDTTMVSRKVRL
ncbi:MAG TPA: M28 family peptidase [Thermoanaerobaculia bacterium]|nr:M28 family peptidase [Thermoanaerobaculia bacterium]